ncbi:hypothetical protein GJ604_25570, partial [Escherichia coli]|uniref:hypothetical protein n=1 Tax=Escherichia coli TaxID=562 RepID=UPI0015858B30
MAARKPRKTAEKNVVNEAMLLAIKAAVAIQKGSGLSERQSHCRFIGEYVVATDDVMIVGVPVKGVSFICCPHSKTLLAAIERCQAEIVFTLDNDVLT